MTPPAHHLPRPAAAAVLAVLAATAAIVLAACGGSSKPSTPPTNRSSAEALAAAHIDRYPTCMRDHGVTNFPDPRVNGTHLTIQINPSVTSSPAFTSAQKACAHLLPAGAGRISGPSPAQQKARIDGLLAFAACLRKHGFPNFPDPTSEGQLTLAMITHAGINLQQPAVQQAGDACVAASHGQITRRDVAQAVANPGG